jgi:16S rRNA (guanine527-N7)-methyltransferase
LDKFLTSHLLDTASLIIPIRNLNLNKNPDYLDVGSGCGVPGIILHSFFPSKTFLCESITKKCKFLEAAVFEVGLKEQVKILNYRSEALGENKDFKNKFNLITARAVAKPNEILFSLEPLLKRGGYFLGQFGEDYELASDTRHLKARDKYFYTTADGRKKYIIVFERC